MFGGWSRRMAPGSGAEIPIRRRWRTGAIAVLVGLACFVAPGISAAAQSTTSFTSPGTYLFTVPVGVSSVSISAIGGAGGPCGLNGGQGASVSGTFAVSAGEQLAVTAGGAGHGCGEFNDVPVLADLCQLPVAPGSSCQIGVRFAPQAKGARTATLTVLSNATNAATPVALSGTGGRPARGSGNNGSGRSGGQVVCQNRGNGTATCEIECSPGTYKIQGTSIDATFTIEQGDRVVTHGSLELKRGTVARHELRLKPGNYTLIISTGQGNHANVLVRLPFRVP
jgi:hypothetical protein